MTSEDQGENTLLEHKKATSCSVVKNKQSSIPVTPDSSEHLEEDWHLPDPDLSLERCPDLHKAGRAQGGVKQTDGQSSTLHPLPK